MPERLAQVPSLNEKVLMWCGSYRLSKTNFRGGTIKYSTLFSRRGPYRNNLHPYFQ